MSIEAAITFAKVCEIESLCNNCFKRLKNKNYFIGLDFESFVENIVDFYCVTNLIHPFREGNGRTQRIFISQLIRFMAMTLIFQRLTKMN